MKEKSFRPEQSFPLFTNQPLPPDKLREVIEEYGLDEQSIDILELSSRSWSVLKAAEIATLGELLLTSQLQILRVRGCGRKSLREMQESIMDFFIRTQPCVEQEMRQNHDDISPLPSRRFILERRDEGFVANGYDSELKIYITIVDSEEQYIDVDELQLEADGTPTAFGWFRDLVYGKIATEISEAEFRDILQDAINQGIPISDATGDRFEKYLKSEIQQDENEPPLESISTKIDIPHNRSIANDLKSRIDMCAFGTVKRYFRSPDTEISQVMIVQEPYDLEVVGAFLVEPRHIGLGLGGLFTRGIVKAGVDDLDKVNASFRDYAILLDTIEDDDACNVLYLPPTYLVKFTGKKWR